ncbi:MAG: bifunctional DNA-formamidopyrimidine glycosylase/DNA-(apurinic or apyrimidinic site) lyase [Polyangiaceae bacterium]|nr:bifunctional DNA-formamidopyrimidine glycosylase/DNA-(apurinic or apyrimidinic site) lyase [Myxococcales bacterium]MCB9584905.1 bifunctional DNA-formamidopyrimidine glycosylase/DNA-(apurinic or apyrimidinic site) lyase [Polyangiaceae bacterium]MCB9607522.1 bifunctional DNA-formamidopyrimidine glycosylase/DNA-(apurinic or apyrimidinic site) lyase [Polyangiaceae bacterium]
MPELPEVEVTRRRIAPLLEGRTISRLSTTEPSYFFLTPPAELKRRLKGRRVSELRRHGKYLFAELDEGDRVMLHLGMTGQLYGAGATSLRLLSSTSRSSLTPEAQAERLAAGTGPDQHTHLVFHFEDGAPDVLFRDVRKFGKVLYIPAGKSDARVEKLGTDALLITADELEAAAGKRRAAVKGVLLDQAVLAGVGNIYADEALFLAKIRPTRPAARLSRADWKRLLDAAQWVMRRSIETGGSSISDYVQPDGSDGAYQDERRVYARTGEPCRECGTAIVRVLVGQRGTHYCPRCQRR